MERGGYFFKPAQFIENVRGYNIYIAWGHAYLQL